MVCRWCLLVAFSAMTMSAQARSGVAFGLLGIAEGQSLRVNALNLGSRSSTPATGCAVTLRLLDAEVVVLRDSAVQTLAGQGASLDPRRALVSDQPGRASVRAVLLFCCSASPVAALLRDPTPVRTSTATSFPPWNCLTIPPVAPLWF